MTNYVLYFHERMCGRLARQRTSRDRQQEDVGGIIRFKAIYMSTYFNSNKGIDTYRYILIHIIIQDVVAISFAL